MRTATPDLGRRRAARVVAAITVLAGALRLAGLGSKPLWLDEALALEWARLPLEELIEGLARVGNHPPLYFLLLHAVRATLGESEAALRVLSVLAGTATVPVFHAFVDRLAGARAAVLAAGLLAISPWHVCYAQEARMYALLTLALAVALAATARLATAGAAATDGAVPRPGRAAVLLALGSGVALWTHASALLWIAASATALLVGARAIDRASRRAWAVGLAAAVALWSPWWIVGLSQARRVAAGFWIQATSWASVVDLWRASTAAFTSAAESAASSLAAPAGALLGLRPLVDVAFAVPLLAALLARGADRRGVRFLATLWLVPPLALVLVSLARPLLLDRALLWTSLPLLALVAIGLARLGTRPRRIVAAAVVLASLLGLRNYHVAFRKEAWDEAAELVARRVGRDDIVLLHANFIRFPFDYYLGRSGVRPIERGLPVDARFARSSPVELGASDIASVPALVAPFASVWLVVGYVPATAPLGELVATLTSIATRVERHGFHAVEVYRFELAPVADVSPKRLIAPTRR